MSPYKKEFIIIYFSGTGNTQLISKEIQQGLIEKGHIVDIVNIEDKEKLKSISFQNKILGFGYPIYKYSYPDIFKELLVFLNDIGNHQQYFQFATYARFPGYALRDFSKAMSKMGYELIAESCFKAPSCGIEARKDQSSLDWESVMFFENDIHNTINGFIDDIQLAQTMPKNSQDRFQNPLSSIVKSVVKDVEKTNYPKLQIDKMKCRVCGLCAKECPDNNLLMDNGSIKHRNNPEI